MNRPPALSLVRSRPLALFVLIVAGAACRVREAPESARLKVEKGFLENQLKSLESLLAQAERGELVTAGQIAIGIDEGVAREILNASLPQEIAAGEHANISIGTAEPYFRGNVAALLFTARITSPDLAGAFAEVELGGGLTGMKLVKGRLQARVSLGHFRVLKASVGPLAQGLVENLVRAKLPEIQESVPPFEVPVRLDQSIGIARFDEGPVAATGGELPLSVEVSQVIAINERLWILIDSKAGPWKTATAAKATATQPVVPTAASGVAPGGAKP